VESPPLAEFEKKEVIHNGIFTKEEIPVKLVQNCLVSLLKRDDFRSSLSVGILL